MVKQIQWRRWLLAALAGTAVSLVGCGGGAGGGSTGASNTTNGGGAHVFTATQLAKLTAGNTLTYLDVTNGNSTSTISGVAQAPQTFTDTSTATTVLGATVASGVPATTTRTTAATATVPSTTTVWTTYQKLDAAGNLVSTTSTGDTYISIPATVGLNTTWTNPIMYTDPATLVKTQIGSQTYTVTGINTSRTVAGLGTFNDVITIAVTGNRSQTAGGITTASNWSATMYISAAVGDQIEAISTSTATAAMTVSGIGVTNTTTTTTTSTLQPGYISK